MQRLIMKLVFQPFTFKINADFASEKRKQKRNLKSVRLLSELWFVEIKLHSQFLLHSR